MGSLFAAAALVVAVPAVAMRVFIDDPAVAAEGIVFLRVIAPFWAFFGGVMVIRGAFRGAGRTTVAMVLSLLSRWVLRVPFAVVFAFAWSVTVPDLGVTVAALDWGVEGIRWAFSVGAFGSFLIAVLWFHRDGWTEGEGGPEGSAAGRTTPADEGGSEFVDD
ncbi:hypothetical protein BRD03_09650 [Halobacteriales archaeon QS_9_68_17]|nr:MAG: hypothetical protein BRD03_09650 [Halobacteriales archaeon QS_9_68_17]